MAAEKLVKTKKTIVEIAYEAGYNSQQSFTYAFHKFYGCPPQEYRTINVHISKYKRFRMESRFIMIYKHAMKGEVTAA